MPLLRGCRRGLDILTIQESNRLGTSDQNLLQFALQQNRVIFTQDADFIRLHSRGNAHAGIVFAAHGTAVGQIVRGLLLIAEVLTPEEMHGHVEFI